MDNNELLRSFWVDAIETNGKHGANIPNLTYSKGQVTSPCILYCSNILLNNEILRKLWAGDGRNHIQQIFPVHVQLSLQHQNLFNREIVFLVELSLNQKIIF